MNCIYHFPTFEQEQRSKEKYIKIRLAALQRKKAEASQLLSEFNGLEAPKAFDIFEPLQKVTVAVNVLKGFNSSIRIPSNAFPNSFAPIKTQAISVPKDPVTKPPKQPINAPKVEIKTPGFSVVPPEDLPTGSADASTDVTHEATQRILFSHSQLEKIQKNYKQGKEIRISSPSSYIYIYDLHEDSLTESISKQFLQSYIPVESKSNKHPEWPPRSYDEECKLMTEMQNVEFNDNIQECKDIYNNYLDTKVKNSQRQQKSKTSRFKVVIGNFITDSSDDFTEPEDYVLGVN